MAKKKSLFDTRVVIKGDNADKVRALLDKKMIAETRLTYGNAISDILLEYFGLKPSK
jgi:hypothetical protein